MRLFFSIVAIGVALRAHAECMMVGSSNFGVDRNTLTSCDLRGNDGSRGGGSRGSSGGSAGNWGKCGELQKKSPSDIRIKEQIKAKSAELRGRKNDHQNEDEEAICEKCLQRQGACQEKLDNLRRIFNELEEGGEQRGGMQNPVYGGG